MINIYELLAAFSTIFLAEFADKTMIATVSLALLSKRTISVVLVSTIAFALANLIVILCAYVLRLFIEQRMLLIASSILFILFGLLYLRFRPKKPRDLAYKSMVLAFTLVFVSELGDKTQLSVLAMALSFSSILNVFLGSVLGYFVLNTLAALILFKYLKVSIKKLTKIVGLIFIAVGVVGLAFSLMFSSML